METNTLVQGFTTMAGNLADGINTIAPVALTVMGAKLIWKIGAKFFAGLATK